MLFFVAIACLVCSSLCAMSEPYLRIDYTQQTQYDKNFVELAKSSYFTQEEFTERFAGLNSSIFDMLALCEISIARNPRDHSVSGFASSELLSHAYAKDAHHEILPDATFKSQFLKYATLAYASSQDKTATLNKLQALLTKNNPQSQLGVTPILQYTTPDTESDVAYYSQLRENLKTANPATTPIIVANMLNGTNGYQKRPFGAIALIAMLQHTHPGSAEPYYMLGNLILKKPSESIFNRSPLLAYHYFEEGLKRSPENARILNCLAVAHYGGNTPTKAKDTVRAKILWDRALIHATACNDTGTMINIQTNLAILNAAQKKAEETAAMEQLRIQHVRAMEIGRQKNKCVIL